MRDYNEATIQRHVQNAKDHLPPTLKHRETMYYDVLSHRVFLKNFWPLPSDFFRRIKPSGQGSRDFKGLRLGLPPPEVEVPEQVHL